MKHYTKFIRFLIYYLYIERQNNHHFISQNIFHHNIKRYQMSHYQIQYMKHLFLHVFPLFFSLLSFTHFKFIQSKIIF